MDKKNSLDTSIFLSKKLGDDYLGMWLSLVFEFLYTKKTITFSKEEKKLKTEILAYVEENIEKMGRDSFNNLLNVLNDEKPEDVIEILEYVYTLFPKYASKNSYDFSPLDLETLALKLLNLEDGDKLIDVGSGNGNFLLKAYQYLNKVHLQSLIGIEINKVLYLQSCILFKILNANLSIELINKDLFALDELPKFNKAFCFPPFGYKPLFGNVYKSMRYDDFEFNRRNSGEWIFIDRIVSKNNKKFNRAAIVTSGASLFNAQDIKYRNKIIKDGFIEGIIELPQKLLPNSKIKLFLVVLSKGNKAIKFLDASNMIKTSKNKNNQLDIDKIVDAYETPSEILTIEEALELTNLQPSKLLNESTSFTGVRIGDFCEVFNGCQYTKRHFEEMNSSKKTGYKIITSSDIADYYIDWNALKSININKKTFDKFSLHENDIVVTSKSTKTKVGVVDKKPDEKIIVTGGMIIIRPDINKVNPVYLKMILDSDYGAYCFSLHQKGDVIKSISAKDIAEIQIPLIPKEDQDLIANNYLVKITTLLALKKQVEVLEGSLKNLFMESMEA